MSPPVSVQVPVRWKSDKVKQEPSNFSPGWLAGSLTALLAARPAGVRRPAATRARVVRLAPGEILRLNKADRAHRLEVRQGTAWLTETPAGEDRLLTAGDNYLPARNWPIVIQALGQTQLVLMIG